MDLALSEIQQMLKTSAREVLAREVPFEVVRAMEGDAQGYTPELWRSMAELGWLGWSCRRSTAARRVPS